MLGHRSRPKKGEWRIPCGIGVWAESSESAFSMDSGTTASAVWTAEDTLLLTIRLYETPMRLTLPCRFQGDTLTVDGTVIGIFGPPEVRLQGRQVAPKSAG
ncbi:MAG: hypothetical protein IPK19_25425 [Chloroflexi bacterium]|nr:hypothetical protein [Chloroflexota bacterium]